MSPGDEAFLDGVLADYPRFSREQKIKLVKYWAARTKPPIPVIEVDKYIEERKKRGSI